LALLQIGEPLSFSAQSLFFTTNVFSEELLLPIARSGARVIALPSFIRAQLVVVADRSRASSGLQEKQDRLETCFHGFKNWTMVFKFNTGEFNARLILLQFAGFLRVVLTSANLTILN